jgi:two-component system response regulator GlrR
MSIKNAPLVLLVDDHIDTLELYEMLLAASGYRVTAASNPADALAKAAAQPPSIVITDLRMPGAVSVLDLCRHFKPLQIPVIVLTGVAGQSEEIEAVEGAGCAAVLIKPVDPDVLSATVSRLLARQDAATPDR